MSEQSGDGGQGSEQPAGPQFSLQRIYLKDVSFESPRSPGGFRGQWKPKVNLELNSRFGQIEGSLFEVVLSVTATTLDESDEVIYLVEVQQAGIFSVSGLDGAQLDKTLGSFCPNLLFPYAREVIDSIVVRGSFPPLMLAPVNFDAIYEQSLAQRAQQQEPH